ncbi:MAG: LON peptidase substrate-binding domain-containing protein [Acidobacteria bacterium]|nr:LON peptidase substrate-binding domain-containing protein [Acidobacteriota bacterium]
MSTELLPLFPLEVVLFPGMPLPLHIFEPRYKLMIRRCREHQQEFGVVLARGGELARVGCSAEIVKVMREYDDGRMDILTFGQQRFRLGQVVEDLPYLQGRVEFLPDEEDPAGGPEASPRLLELYAEVFRLVHGRQPKPLSPEPGASLAYFIGRELPLDLDSRQALLERVSETERQQSLAEQLEVLLPQLRRLERVKQKAGGNGRGR